MDFTIPPLDDDAMTAAYAALPRRHGRLDGLAVWLAGVHGAAPPHRPRRPRVVVFGSSDVTGDVTVSEGSFADGLALADREVDAGADLAVVVAPATPAAAAVVAALSGAEPVDVVAAGPEWARQVAAVRDLLRAHRAAEPVDLAAAAGLAAVAGFLVGAARRRTPVLLDGLAPAAAALVAARLAPEAVAWFAAGHLTPDPGHARALEALGLTALLDLGIAADGGALLALPLLDAAAGLFGGQE